MLIEISVSDSGQGIPKDEISQLFNRYFRARTAEGKVKGTGLGLYIVKSIVEAHNGRVQVESELGKGTTFSIILPVSLEETKHRLNRIFHLGPGGIVGHFEYVLVKAVYLVVRLFGDQRAAENFIKSSHGHLLPGQVGLNHIQRCQRHYQLIKNQ